MSNTQTPNTVTRTFGPVKVGAKAKIGAGVKAYDEAQILGNAQVSGYVTLTGDAYVYGFAKVTGSTVIFNDNEIRSYRDCKIFGGTWFDQYVTNKRMWLAPGIELFEDGVY